MLYEFDHQHLEELRSVTGTAMPNAVGPTDEELLARVQARDESAIGVLMGRHAPLLRTIVSRVVHNDADTADVFQDVFIEVWKHAAHYNATKGKALGWLVTMTRRRAIDRIRRRQAYDRAEERLRHEIETDSADRFHSGADEQAQHSDRLQILREVLNTLPRAQREAIELAYFHGLSQREIAKTTGIPLGTIKTRLELGMRKVHAAILQLGGAQEWASPAANLS